MKMPPDERTIIAPDGGWEESSWYQVEVAFRQGNPVHKALLYTGFLNGIRSDRKKGSPGGYHILVNPSWDRNCFISDLHYLKPIACLGQLTKDQYI
ncbi:hypothetical protein [Pelagibacterium sp.]|jgi:hypothetical protein|uniref:hypothetical protein n=1 Tax=Pelagibacterium sp. TaxID=1967288 RepID=UPI003A904F00